MAERFPIAPSDDDTHGEYLLYPTIERAYELLDRAYGEGCDRGDIRVLGWADNMVMEPVSGSLNFTVDKRPSSPCGHEDMVVVLAFRVPHPDEMPLADVLGQESFEGDCTITDDGRHQPIIFSSKYDGDRWVCDCCGVELVR